MNIFDFTKKKENNEKISIVTCYDYTSARILANTNVDCLLVGDSVAMTMHGYKNTLSANLEMMCTHTSAVSRGAGSKFIITDMPFLSFRKSLSKNVAAAGALMTAGAHALKIENATGNLAFIRHLTESGIPVMGHLGLTMQLMHMIGGLKVQGKSHDAAMRMQEDALALQDAGCFSLVLECIPNALAKTITKSLHIPTIGIGAGLDTDGQVLVLQDLLGLTTDFKPKFVKHFSNGVDQVKAGVDKFVSEVNSGSFQAMNIVTSINEWRDIRQQFQGKSIGLVHTMGNLHAGHLSLCARSQKENDITVAAIFINPTQFNQASDFDLYPRTIEQDKALLVQQGVDYLLLFPATELYRDQYQVQVSETEISKVLEGEYRPGHFTGMLTIVLKFLNIVSPTRSYYGEKDFQQLMLIKKMAHALFLPIEIVGCETKRADDNLALSSRNNRLTQEQRVFANNFPKLLQSTLSAEEVAKELQRLGFKVDYVMDLWQRRLAAVWLGDVRLIDNIPL